MASIQPKTEIKATAMDPKTTQQTKTGVGVGVGADAGYLELIFGPMYSGKTSKLLDLYKQFCFCNIPTTVINYNEDTRYSTTMLSTHDKAMIPCVHAHLLREVDVSAAKVILINEGQFFADIVPWVKEAVEVQNKHVYICGLDGDFQRQAFSSHWLDLVPFCDNIVKLRSFCSQCKTHHALFSHRLSSEAEQIVIGSSNYVPLCRSCYVTATAATANV